ncbi:MAG: CDP-alcohol phosphatidyltransferase family protein [bacterium]
MIDQQEETSKTDARALTLSRLWGMVRPTYLWTRYIDHPPGVLLAWLSLRLGIGARILTVLTAIPVLFGAYSLLVFPHPWNLVGFLVAIQLSYIVDCADGPVARATGAASGPGAYLDRLIDFFSLAVIGIGYSRYIVVHIPSHSFILWSAVAFFVTRALSYSAQFMKPETKGPMASLSENPLVKTVGQFTDTGLWWFFLPLFVWKDPLWIPLAFGALLNLSVYLKGIATAYRGNVPTAS